METPSGYIKIISDDEKPAIPYEDWARGDIANKAFIESLEKWTDLLNEFSDQMDRFNKLLLNFADILKENNDKSA